MEGNSSGMEASSGIGLPLSQNRAGARGHLVAGLMLASVPIIACGPDTAGLGTLSVPELAALFDQDKSVVVCYANNEDTRGKYGSIPGARLLSDYRD